MARIYGKVARFAKIMFFMKNILACLAPGWQMKVQGKIFKFSKKEKDRMLQTVSKQVCPSCGLMPLADSVWLAQMSSRRAR